MSNLTDCSHLHDQFRSRYRIDDWKAIGYFEDDDLLDINCYWLNFEPRSPIHHIALAVVYGLVFIVGTTSNITAAYILLSTKKLRKPSNMYLVNLCVSDLLMMSIIPMFLVNSVAQGPAMGHIGCQLHGFLGGLSGTVAIMTLAAVAVDRHQAISRPLDYRASFVRVFATILLIWLYSALFSVLPLFGIGKYVPEGYLTTCSFDYLTDDISTKVFIIVYCVGAWAYPMALICYSYCRIIGAVRLVRSSFTDEVDNGTDNSRVIKGRKKKKLEIAVAMMSLKLVIVWFVAWTPYAAVSLIGISNNGHVLTPFSSMLPATVAKIAACIDPYIYVLSHPKIRIELFRRLLPRWVALRARTDRSTFSTSRHIESPTRNRFDRLFHGVNPAARSSLDNIEADSSLMQRPSGALQSNLHQMSRLCTNNSSVRAVSIISEVTRV